MTSPTPFPLRPDLASLHDDAIAHASVIQSIVARRGGCQSMSSEALNALHFIAILTHRSVRTLCEEGWTPTASILNRTMIDLFASCVAIVNDPTVANYMGFKYMTHFTRKWMADPDTPAAELVGLTAFVNDTLNKLQPPDQT